MAANVWQRGALQVTCPEGYQVSQITTPTGSRSQRRFAPDQSIPAATRLVIDALAQQELDLLPPMELVPTRPPTNRGIKRGAPAPLAIDVTVDSAEDAVVLIEHDGVLSWHKPNARVHQPVSGDRRRGATAQRIIHFDLWIASKPPTGSAAARGRGLGGLLLGRVRAYVFKFIARAVTGQAMAFLERHVRTGLLAVDSTDTRQWRAIEDLSAVTLPTDRPARILLLVHGTFSSTVGSFGALGSGAGKGFLESAIEAYDAVIGYDHATLSVDPLANAVDLLARLEKRSFDTPPTIDIICYSRGALVARSLVEYLLPSSPWQGNVDRIVFVGGTNGGTGFADPRNWDELADVYTNLASAAARAVGLITGAVPAAEVVRGLISGVGAFVKYLAAYATDGGGVPGLAAMEPRGAFVRKINEMQPKQPEPGTPWFVVSSDFQPRLVGEGQLEELPARLLGLLANGFVDQLIGASNDLVVDTRSMDAIDPATGGFVKDTLAFGANGRVYHLAYFIQPEVAAALHDWLIREVETRVVQPGSTVPANLPRAARRDVVTLDIDTTAGEALRHVRSRSPSWVILGDARAENVHYAVRPGSLTGSARSVGGASTTLRDVIAGAGISPGRTLNLREVAKRGVSTMAIAESGTIILDKNEPVAVTNGPPRAVALDALRGKRIRNPRTPDPAASERPPGQATTEKTTDPILHVDAQMPERVGLHDVVTVSCRLARESLPLLPGQIGGDKPVDADRPIIVQLFAKENAETHGTDRCELALPPAGEPADLLFDFKPTRPGLCTVWVVARQDPAPLVTLKLTAAVENSPPPSPVRATTAQATVAAAPLEGLEDVQWLRIDTSWNGDAVSYNYTLWANQAELLSPPATSKPMRNVASFVNRLYTDLERDRAARAKDRDDFQDLLQELGGTLLDELVPEEFQQFLWDYRDKLSNLLVVTDDTYIPWELVHLKQPGEPLPDEPDFLGQRGLMRWLWHAQGGGFPSRTLRARPGKVWALCPKYVDENTALPEAAREEAFLRDRLKARPVVNPTEIKVKRLLVKGRFDVFHFAGHGEADGQQIDQAQILVAQGPDEDDFLRARTVAQYVKFDDADGGPLIVLNACQAGRTGVVMSNLGGFASAFVTHGAAAFVSTLWSVGDKPARTFVEALYDALLTGDSMSAAVVTARKAARDAGDATWLAYTVYANPAARLSIT